MEIIMIFQGVHKAMESEQIVKNHGYQARLIPIPGAISAGCGLGLKADESLMEALVATFQSEELEPLKAYRIHEDTDTHKKNYELIKEWREA
ncbi:MAG: DUF3343 domain-containing protein [Aerococcus sp.]|nr:DUF3343 domain-containing protein [Aerococcus sp.]